MDGQVEERERLGMAILMEQVEEIIARLPTNPGRFRSKLSAEKARRIRAQYPQRTLADLGKEFGVSKEAVRQVVIGATWREDEAERERRRA
jgi:DNA-directed RNA polymerase sigma subunit (sigma70/sigma32)